MDDIIEVIKNLKNLRHVKAASQTAIEAAEKSLGLTFAPDYKQYVLTYGAINAQGFEFTGLNVSAYINVVDVTLEEREREDIPATYYVLENTGIDGILILQNSEGQIFEYYNGDINLIAGSIAEYIMLNQD